MSVVNGDACCKSVALSPPGNFAPSNTCDHKQTHIDRSKLLGWCESVDTLSLPTTRDISTKDDIGKVFNPRTRCRVGAKGLSLVNSPWNESNTVAATENGAFPRPGQPAERLGAGRLLEFIRWFGFGKKGSPSF